MKITLELGYIQADLLRTAIDNQIEDLRFSDCEHDTIDMVRLCELRNTIEKEIKNAIETETKK